MKYEEVVRGLHEGFFSGGFPRPRRVELGVLLCGYLKRRSEAAQDDDEYKDDPVQFGDSVGLLFGIPIDIPKNADPWSWRFLDANGQVIKEGTAGEGEVA